MAAIGRTQFPKVRLLGVGWLAGLALICAASTLPAQGVTPLNPTTMQFTDPAHGVSFTYPASWTLDKDQKKHLRTKFVKGWELVPNTARLCIMNLYLHGINSQSDIRQ